MLFTATCAMLRSVGGELDVARRVGLAVAILLALSSLFASPHGEITDHHVYVSTVDRMHHGASYYDAMDGAMREVYGPSESVRAFRMPTLFLLWRLLPSSAWLRAAFAAMAVVTALAVFAIARNPISPTIVVAYVLNAGGVGLRRGDAAQYTTVELWVVPVVLVAWLGWRKRDAFGAAGAVAAFVVREFAALLFVGGVLAALCSRDRRISPWLVGVAVAAAAYAAHAAAVSPLLVAHGHETPLHGSTPAVRSLFDMLAFQLPLEFVAGPVLLGVALIAAWQREELAFLAPYAALPLLGLVADRPYWGAMIVPVLLVSALDLRVPARIAPHLHVRARGDVAPPR